MLKFGPAPCTRATLIDDESWAGPAQFPALSCRCHIPEPRIRRGKSKNNFVSENVNFIINVVLTFLGF